MADRSDATPVTCRPASVIQPTGNVFIHENATMGYQVTVERTDDGFVARNPRGTEIRFGTGGGDAAFTPVELLLAALGGCNIVTVEPLTAQRGHRLVRLTASVTAEKIKVNQLGAVNV